MNDTFIKIKQIEKGFILLKFHDLYHLKIKSEIFLNTNFQSHRENNLPAEIYYNIEGKIIQKRWLINGHLQSYNDYPAMINYLPDGNIHKECWYKDNNLHRENDLPAIITYYQDGLSIDSKIWYQFGKTHREGDLPAVIGYYQNGIKNQEDWYKNNELHREGDLPAEIYYYENGNFEQITYYKNGNMHREGDLPAQIHYFLDGTIDCEKWYRNNKIFRFGYTNNFELKPSKINYGNENQKKYIINGRKLNSNKYYKFIYLFRKSIQTFRIKKRKEVLTLMKRTKLNKMICNDINQLITRFVY